MKLVKVLIVLGLIAVAVSKAKVKQNDNNQEAVSFSDGRTIDGTAYGLGSNGGFTLKNNNVYKVPSITEHLLKRESAYIDGPSSKLFADESPSITHYYDGSNKLNSTRVQCRMYTNMNECLHQSGCGWCGATATCITGNQAGPLEACSKSTYVFTTGAIPNAEQRVIKENIGGMAITLLQNR